MPDLNYKILTVYEAAGVEQAMQGFEKQRGVAKALGQDYSELDSKIKQLNTALEESKLGQEKAAAEAKDFARGMGVVTVSHEDLEKATKKTKEAVGESTGEFSKARREIREVGSVLGNTIGISHLGGLALGGVAAAAFGAAKAIGFLKNTWDEIKGTISGPIKVGLPEDLATKIYAAAEAWEAYAAARSKVIAADNSPGSVAGREEKGLNEKLRLIHQVMKAEEEEALAALKLKKDQMSPEAYKAAEDNIKSIFGKAGTKADEENRGALISVKDREAYALEMSAREKTAQASGIKAAPEAVAKNNQKTLDENAAAAATAKTEITERLAMIDRVERGSHGGSVAEYEGSYGKIQQFSEGMVNYQRYGPLTFNEMRGIEKPRLAQAQAQIDIADTYNTRQQKNAAEKKRLMEEAGTESGQAVVLRSEMARDYSSARTQAGVDNFSNLEHRAAQAMDHNSDAQKNLSQGPEEAGAQKNSSHGYEEATAQLKASQEVGRELAQAATEAAAAHSNSLGAITKALNDIRASNLKLMDWCQRNQNSNDLH